MSAKPEPAQSESERWEIMDRIRLTRAALSRTATMVNVLAYEDAMREVLEAQACLQQAREQIQAVCDAR